MIPYIEALVKPWRVSVAGQNQIEIGRIVSSFDPPPRMAVCAV
jgi:hypothetical protein